MLDSNIVISFIYYDGVEQRTEGDEYAEITNTGDSPENISGWQLAAGGRARRFTFPDGTTLDPGESLRVYTDRDDPATGGFSYGSKQRIWNNQGDIGTLYDPAGNAMFRYPYGSKAPDIDADGARDASPDAQVASSYLYWGFSGNSLSRANLDGSSQNILLTGLARATSVAVDPVTEAMFYTHSDPSKIARAGLDGSNAKNIVSTADTVASICIDSANRKLYWSELRTGRVMRSELDGTDVQSVIESSLWQPYTIGLDVKNGKLYAFDYKSFYVRRVNLDGSGLETIGRRLRALCTGMVVDPNTEKLYVTTRNRNIEVMDCDGSSRGEFVTDQITAWGLAIDLNGGKLYWSAMGAIRRADLTSGGNIEDVVALNTSELAMSLAVMPPS